MKRLEKINNIRVHPDNPRLIKNHKFRKLVKSIKDFPEMLEKRPLIVNKDLVCLGGNMRLKAAREAGVKKIWIDVADWSEEKQREFIIKDNSGFGEWDWDILANEWVQDKLNDWGLDLPLDFNEDLKDEDLHGEEKKEKPSIKITFQNVKDLEEAELIIKDLILKYKNSFYSVS